MENKIKTDIDKPNKQILNEMTLLKKNLKKLSLWLLN